MTTLQEQFQRVFNNIPTSAADINSASFGSPASSASRSPTRTDTNGERNASSVSTAAKAKTDGASSEKKPFSIFLIGAAALVLVYFMMRRSGKSSKSGGGNGGSAKKEIFDPFAPAAQPHSAGTPTTEPHDVPVHGTQNTTGHAASPTPHAPPAFAQAPAAIPDMPEPQYTPTQRTSAPPPPPPSDAGEPNEYGQPKHLAHVPRRTEGGAPRRAPAAQNNNKLPRKPPSNFTVLPL